MKIAAKVVVATGCVIVAMQSAQAQVYRRPARVRIDIEQGLPAMNGKNLKISVLEVSYAPAGASPVHSHPCPVIGYVVEGSIRTRVKGQPEKIYHVGETFYEAPNAIHEISENASDVTPAKFIAYFVCDRVTPLSTAAPGQNPNEGGQ